MSQFTTQVRSITTGVLLFPTQVVRSNPHRIWISFIQIGAGGATFLCTMASGLQDSCLFGLQDSVDVVLLRKDLGPLVDGELWFSDGNGNTPACTMTITEGILIP